MCSLFQQRKGDVESCSSSSLAQEHQSQFVNTRRTRSNIKKASEGTTKQTQSMTPKNKSISVGQNYQVLVLPDSDDGGEVDYPDRDECLWLAQHQLDDGQLVQYCREALKNSAVDLQRALYILYKCSFDLNEAKRQASTRRICKAEFSTDDAFAFKNAYIFFGKNFTKIRQVIPHKTIFALVEHYYLTKKLQNYKSFTDNDMAQSGGDSESEQDLNSVQIKSELHEPVCEVCKNVVHKLYSANGLELCRTCKQYFKSMNKHRVCTKNAEEIRRVPICPPEMKAIAEQFQEMTQTAHKFEDPDGTGDVQVAKKGKTVCEEQIIETKKAQRQLQAETKRLEISLRKRSENSVVDEARKFLEQTTINSSAPRKYSYSWSVREKEAALHALIRFEGNCDTVSDILCTKSSNMVKSFYTKYEADIQKILAERTDSLERDEKPNIEKNPNHTNKSDPDIIELE